MLTSIVNVSSTKQTIKIPHIHVFKPEVNEIWSIGDKIVDGRKTLLIKEPFDITQVWIYYWHLYL